MEREFRRGDRVIVLSGKDIPNYYGGWRDYKEKYVGCLFTISEIELSKRDRRLGFRFAEDDDYLLFDSRGVRLVERSGDTFKASYEKFISEYV